MSTETIPGDLRTPRDFYDAGYGELKRRGNIPLGRIRIPLLEVLYINKAEFDPKQSIQFDTSNKALTRYADPPVNPDFVFTYEETTDLETGKVRRIYDRKPVVSRGGVIKTGALVLAGITIGGLTIYEWLSSNQSEEKPDSKPVRASIPTSASLPITTNLKDMPPNPNVPLETFGSTSLMRLFADAPDLQSIIDQDSLEFTSSYIINSTGKPAKIINNKSDYTFLVFEDDGHLVVKIKHRPDPMDPTNPLWSTVSLIYPDGKVSHIPSIVPYIEEIYSVPEDTLKLISKVSKIPENQILVRFTLNPPAILYLDKRDPQTGLALPLAVNESINIKFLQRAKKQPIMAFTRLVKTVDNPPLEIWKEKDVDIELETMLIPISRGHEMRLKDGRYFFGDKSLADIMTERGVVEASELFIPLNSQVSTPK